jgi:hypothetical protein
MYAPNLEGLVLVLVEVLALPLLLGAVATLLAGLEGASAGPHLRTGRRLIAATTGALVGCLALAGAACFGLYVALSASTGLAGCFLAIVLASVLGLLLAYRSARAIAARLNRYRCAGCRVWFRAQWPTERCPRCTEERENAEGNWSSEFEARWRELAGRGPAGQDGAPDPGAPERR